MEYIDIIKGASSLEIMCAGEWEEFFYEDSDEQVVPEGHPVGFDVDTDEGVELVLFDNIYWNPKYENE